jgi:RHS repeat-associated protein
MLDGLDVIHMNGRIYDSALGRFLQADPIVQDPTNGQNFNRYIYVWNNPLAYTDPSGFSSKALFLQIASIAINFFLPGASWFIGLVGKGLLNAVVTGFISGIVASAGSLKSGLVGAFSAGVFFGIGEHFQLLSNMNPSKTAGLGLGQQAAKVLAHGMAGGVITTLQGGRFGHGFLSAGVTEAAAPGLSRIGHRAVQSMAAMLVGGATSALTGGKFANGAITSAFAWAFNQARHDGASRRATARAESREWNVQIEGDTDGRVSLALRRFLRVTYNFSEETGSAAISLPRGEAQIRVSEGGRIRVAAGVPVGPGVINVAGDLIDGFESIGYDMSGGSFTLYNWSRDGVDFRVSYRNELPWRWIEPMGTCQGRISFNAQEFVNETFVPGRSVFEHQTWDEAHRHGLCRAAGDCP